jgi:hypothetical protein
MPSHANPPRERERERERGGGEGESARIHMRREEKRQVATINITVHLVAQFLARKFLQRDTYPYRHYRGYCVPYVFAKRLPVRYFMNNSEENAIVKVMLIITRRPRVFSVFIHTYIYIYIYVYKYNRKKWRLSWRSEYVIILL